jgi:hypothetical protein
VLLSFVIMPSAFVRMTSVAMSRVKSHYANRLLVIMPSTLLAFIKMTSVVMSFAKSHLYNRLFVIMPLVLISIG